jgi:hypothetical protein
MTRNPQRGEGKLKTFIWLFILATAIYLVVKIVPHYVNNYELQDAMRSEALHASYNRKTDADVRDTIYKKVRDLDIQQIRREDIKVETGQLRCKISVKYTVPVELPGYTLNLNFNIVADNRAP